MSYRERFEDNNADLQVILDKVRAMPDAGGTQTVVVTNTNCDGLSFSYFSPNYPDWVTIAPNQTITDKISECAIYGIFYDHERMDSIITYAPKCVLDLCEGNMFYPNLYHTADRVRLFIAESDANVAISVY